MLYNIACYSLTSNFEVGCCMVVTPVKVATVPQPHPIDNVLRSAVLPLLQPISDRDRCSTTLNTMAHLLAAWLKRLVPPQYVQWCAFSGCAQMFRDGRALCVEAP